MKCHHYCNEPTRCPHCIRRFWKWAENHTQARGKKPPRVETALSFYESTFFPG